MNQEFFDHDMGKIGYTERIFNNENETWKYQKSGQRDVETLFIDDPPELLSPIAVPDFDINTLMWDGQRMSNWTDPQAGITPSCNVGRSSILSIPSR